MRPAFVEESIVSIEEGRHPVMEAILHAHFVPNDLLLRAADHRFILLTGPNMGGKSTYLRQTGLLTIMAQIGSFVPAKRMTLGVVDRIFTRIGAGDDLASGQSTFYMEMAEAANILRRSTHRSLLLIDEVGRGTGTLDGLSIAQAMCEFLLGLEEQAPMALFATHFHELCSLAEHWGARRQLSHDRRREYRARRGAGLFASRAAGKFLALVRHRSRAHGGAAGGGRRAGARDRRRALRTLRRRSAGSAAAPNEQTHAGRAASSRSCANRKLVCRFTNSTR